MTENIVNLNQCDTISSAGGTMPIKNCVRYGTKLYCYDEVEKIVYVYPEQKYDVDEVPKEVIARIIQRNFDTQIVIEGSPESHK